MEGYETIVHAANLLLHQTNGAGEVEQVLGLETLKYYDRFYQLQICLVPKSIFAAKRRNSKVCEAVQTSHTLDTSTLILSSNQIKDDKDLGKFTDIEYLIQYVYVQGYKYALELRMTSTNQKLIQFEQLN